MHAKSMTVLVAALLAILSGIAVAQRPGKKNSDPKPDPKKQPTTQPTSQPVFVVTDPKAETEVKDVSTTLGKDLLYLESDNFTYASSINEARMRPIMDGVERVYEKFSADAGIKQWADLFGPQRPMVLLVPTKREYDQYVAWYAEKYPVYDKAKFKTAKQAATYFFTTATRPVLITHVKPNDDEFLKQVICHLAGHVMVHRYKFHNNFVPPWLEEGAAIFYEGMACGKVACRCFSGSFYGKQDAVDPTIVHGQPLDKFRAKAKSDVGTTRSKNMTALWKMQLGELTLEDVEKAYVCISWMASQPGKFPEFLKAMKKAWPAEVTSLYSEAKGKAQETAFKEVFGKTMDEIEAALKAHVQGKF